MTVFANKLFAALCSILANRFRSGGDMKVFTRYAVLAVWLCVCAIANFAQNSITCSSEDGKRHYCNAESRYGVNLVRQRSGSPCNEGTSWGFDDRGVWVDHGCRADFAPRPGVTCSSEDGRRHYCNAETRAGVAIVRQRSGSPCTQNYSWGFDDRGIWVDHGCRADFALEAGPAYDDDSVDAPPTITCSSDDGGRNFCDADTRRGVRILRQISGSPCAEGQTWGYDGRGIWVDRGCRAEFALRTRRRRDYDRDRSDYHNYDNNGDPFADRTVSCSSDDGRRHYCDAENRAGVRLIKQRSDSACTQGYSWGVDDRGIWVDHGCRADFALETGRSYDDSNDSQLSCLRAVGPEHSKQMVDQCLQVSPATHPPCNAQNSCSLIVDEIRRGCAQLGRDTPGFCEAYR
jgi:hypothetical protein